MDASSTGVGAVLSQRQESLTVLHPCAFYSHKLTPAEHNYDINDRELLAIKLALEEWRHWLEGSYHPLLILTDHKNLQYIKEAKRLNPQQSWWAMFFSRFHFKISYRPGSKNSCADALSRMFSPPDEKTVNEPVLPDSLFVAIVHWGAHHLDCLHLFPNIAEPSKPSITYWALATLGPTQPSKSSRHLPSGKHFTLPTPNRPWSHLGVDFFLLHLLIPAY